MKIARVMFDGRVYEGIVTKLGFVPYSGSFYDDTAYPEDLLFPLDEIRYLVPCQPKSIVAVGKNYLDHIKEFNGAVPDHPILFQKPLSSMIAHRERIVLPQGIGRVDYEGELAFVIKKTAKNISVEEAADYILGYTCLLDISAREIQQADGQWFRAKGFDTFCPIGPVIETAFDFPSAAITTTQNGQKVQCAPCSSMCFGPHMLLSYISSFMTLCPGDIVSTGTPAGVGPIFSGDTLEVTVGGIGTLINKVI